MLNKIKKKLKYLGSIIIIFGLFGCGPSIEDALEAEFNSVEELKIANDSGFENRQMLKSKTGWDNFDEWQIHKEAGYESREDFIKATSFQSLNQQNEYSLEGFDNMDVFLSTTGFQDLPKYLLYKANGFLTYASFIATGFQDLPQYLLYKANGFLTYSSFIATGFSDIDDYTFANKNGVQTLDEITKKGFRSFDEFKSIVKYGSSINEIEKKLINYETFYDCKYGILDYYYVCKDKLALFYLDGYGERPQRWLEDYYTFEYNVVESCKDIPSGNKRYTADGVKVDQRADEGRNFYGGCSRAIVRIKDENFSTPDIKILYVFE